MFFQVLYFCGLAVFTLMLATFVFALIKKNTGFVDVAWGLGFVLVAFLSFGLRDQLAVRPWLLTFLVVVWGVRLAVHIWMRNWGKAEDFRYATWRKEWGDWFVVRSFSQIFMLQGILMMVVVSPLLLVNVYAASLEGVTNTFMGARVWMLDLVGLFLWGVGFVFEVVGDWQLGQFVKRKVAGKMKKEAVMTTGLWKFTRHPNYFGEVTLWWGFFILALPILWEVRWGFVTVLSPVLITCLILFVSGIPLLEKKYQGNREFSAYKKRTNAFFPWFPKAR